MIIAQMQRSQFENCVAYRQLTNAYGRTDFPMRGERLYFGAPAPRPAGYSVDRFVVISGCSGGGKSTLLDELSRRGHAVVEEPGRRIVKEELKGNGSALPWVDEAAFAHRAIEMALADRVSASALEGWVFFEEV